MEWISTGQAAEMLGTSNTTIRAMAMRGDLDHRVTPGSKRQKWEILRPSVVSWLTEKGRFDDRRQQRPVMSAPDADVSRQLAGVMQQLQYVEADRDRLSDEVAVLRAVALQLRARNDAITEAETHQAQAAKLLLDAAQAQARAAEALRRGLSAQDDALGQFLIPSPPKAT